MNEKKNVKSALCEMVLPVISLSVSNADQEEDPESLSPERFVNWFVLQCCSLFFKLASTFSVH